MLDGSQMPDPGLIFDGVEDLVDWKPEWSELLYELVSSAWTWREDLKHLLLVGRLSLVLILGMEGSFMQRLRLSSIVAMLGEVVDGSLHCLFRLDIGLSSR